MPLLFAALLMPCYEAIRAGRVTQLVHATSFLHADYKPQFSWWEFVFLSQRLILVGFVQFPSNKTFTRLLHGTVVVATYLIALLIFRPYRRWSINAMAIICQSSLIVILFCALSVHLFSELDAREDEDFTEKVLGLTTTDGVVTTLLVVNASVLLLFVVLASHHAIHDWREIVAHQLESFAEKTKASVSRFSKKTISPKTLEETSAMKPIAV